MKTVDRAFRERRDFQGMTQRRLQAARLFARGKKQAEVARMLGVTRQSVSRWFLAFEQGGKKSLKGAGRAGRRPKLNRAQLVRVEAALRQGARAHGFGANFWTLPRVAGMIAKVTGVKYHPGHVWRILRSLDWSRQRSARRARGRNDAAVWQWVQGSRSP